MEVRNNLIKIQETQLAYNNYKKYFINQLMLGGGATNNTNKFENLNTTNTTPLKQLIIHIQLIDKS